MPEPTPTLDQIEVDLRRIEEPLEKMAELQRLWAELEETLGGALARVKTLLSHLDEYWFGRTPGSPGPYFSGRLHDPEIIRTSELRDRCTAIVDVLTPPKTGWNNSMTQYVFPTGSIYVAPKR